MSSTSACFYFEERDWEEKTGSALGEPTDCFHHDNTAIFKVLSYFSSLKVYSRNDHVIICRDVGARGEGLLHFGHDGQRDCVGNQQSYRRLNTTTSVFNRQRAGLSR